jgi:hypothetical protein
MPMPRQAHRATTRVLSLIMVGIGLALIVLAVAGGGGPLAKGVVLGALFLALGAGRLYLQARYPDV